jgi:hypothetical protein
MASVEFRPVPDFHGYTVGSDGSVWSYKNRQGGVSPHARRLKPCPNRDGHLVVRLYRDGKSCHRFIHQLVLAAFVGPCPDGMEACHDPDPDPANNDLSNLRWDTRKGNAADCIRHGRRPRGEVHGRAKVTEEDIPVIKSRLKSGETKASVGRRYGISSQQVRRIAAGEQWGHLN